MTSRNVIEIARATEDDIPLIVPLFDAHRQFYKQASDPEGAQRFLAGHFKRDTSVIFLAYITDLNRLHDACGFTQLYPSFSSGAMRPLWILNDLFVAPEARKMGVGRALLERARIFAADSKARGLTLKTGVDNLPAQALYKTTGWKRDDEFCSYNLYF